MPVETGDYEYRFNESTTMVFRGGKCIGVKTFHNRERRKKPVKDEKSERWMDAYVWRRRQEAAKKIK